MPTTPTRPTPARPGRLGQGRRRRAHKNGQQLDLNIILFRGGGLELPTQFVVSELNKVGFTATTTVQPFATAQGSVQRRPAQPRLVRLLRRRPLPAQHLGQLERHRRRVQLVALQQPGRRQADRQGQHDPDDTSRDALYEQVGTTLMRTPSTCRCGTSTAPSRCLHRQGPAPDAQRLHHLPLRDRRLTRWPFVLRRLASVIPVLLGSPSWRSSHPPDTRRPGQGDPLRVQRDAEQIDQLRVQLGLDQPLWKQYLDFLGQLRRGDLGTSYLTQNSVRARAVLPSAEHAGAHRSGAARGHRRRGAAGLVAGTRPNSLFRQGGPGGVVPRGRGAVLLPRAGDGAAVQRRPRLAAGHR